MAPRNLIHLRGRHLKILTSEGSSPKGQSSPQKEARSHPNRLIRVLRASCCPSVPLTHTVKDGQILREAACNIRGRKSGVEQKRPCEGVGKLKDVRVLGKNQMGSRARNKDRCFEKGPLRG